MQREREEDEELRDRSVLERLPLTLSLSLEFVFFFSSRCSSAFALNFVWHQKNYDTACDALGPRGTYIDRLDRFLLFLSLSVS